MIPSQITTHVDDAIDRLIEHFSGPDKPVLNGLLTTYAQGIQDLEDALWAMIYGRLLIAAPGQAHGAVGVHLDTIGRLIGAPREGLDDDTYRVLLLLTIRVNRSFGTTVDLLEIARLAIGDAYGEFVYREEAVLSTYFYFEALPVPIAIILVRALEKARAAGTRAVVEYYTDRVDSTTVFLWANGATGGQGGFANGSSGDGGLLTAEQG